jgi:hypothetical protein
MVFSIGAVDGLVWEVNGAWVIGIVRTLVGIVTNLVMNACQASRLARLNA